MIERRQFVRFPGDGLVSFREIRLPKQLLDGREAICHNFSPGGILFESPRPVPVGAMLKLEIELRDWSRRIDGGSGHPFAGLPLKLLGETVTCEEDDPGRTWRIGVKFVGLDAKYQEAILQYLQESFEETP